MPLPGIAQNVGGIGIGDPFFQNVILLMHFDSSLTEQNQYSASQTFTIVGDPNLTSRSETIFGSAIRFDGTGDNLHNDDLSYWNFGTGDFTVELSVYTSQKDNNRGIFDMRSSSSGSGLLIENLSSGSGVLNFRLNDNDYFSTTDINNSTWYQLAVSRVSGVLHTYINGSRVDTSTFTTNLNSNRLTLGTYVNQRGTGTNYHWNGYMDELRITKGIGRYSGATYQLQGGPFPNH